MRRLRDPLLRAWAALMLLSLGSTVIARLVGTGGLGRASGLVAGAAILALAWAKARVILARYLGLAQAPSWRPGFEIVLGVYALGLLGLYLAAGTG